MLPSEVYSELNTVKRFPASSSGEMLRQHISDIISAKGPVFSTAIIAGVMAAKKTSDLIPFCHPIALDSVDITIDLDTHHELDRNNNSSHSSNVSPRGLLTISCIAKTSGKTGVEMEAMVGASTAALCCYDMLKALSHEITISSVELVHKSGGKSVYNRK